MLMRNKTKYKQVALTLIHINCFVLFGYGRIEQFYKLIDNMDRHIWNKSSNDRAGALFGAEYSY